MSKGFDIDKSKRKVMKKAISQLNQDDMRHLQHIFGTGKCQVGQHQRIFLAIANRSLLWWSFSIFISANLPA